MPDPGGGCARVSLDLNKKRQRSVRAAVRIASDILAGSQHGLPRPVIPQGLAFECGIQFTVAAVGRACESAFWEIKASLVAYPWDSSFIRRGNQCVISSPAEICWVSAYSRVLLRGEQASICTYPDAPSARARRSQRRHGDLGPCALGLTPARKAFLVQLRALALGRAGGGLRTMRSQSTARSLMVGDDSQ